MAFKVAKQFVSILVRSKKVYRGIPYKSSLQLEREIEMIKRSAVPRPGSSSFAQISMDLSA